MALLEKLLERSHGKCELCSKPQELTVYQLPPSTTPDETNSLVSCDTCRSQIDHPATLDPNHWHCLNESMWSEHRPVQVMAYRLLSLMKSEVWAQDLLAQLYLDDEALAWAQTGLPAAVEIDLSTPTLDSHGTRLLEGDSVTLIKDLEVKGAGFTAKRGTLVKNIGLTNNPKHIEGKVNGIQIILISAYLKKA